MLPGKKSAIDLVFHKMTACNLLADIVDKNDVSIDNLLIATYRFRHDGRDFVLTLHESLSVPALRLPFDEDSIVEKANFDAVAKTISLTNHTDFSSIEIIVALNKKLMQAVYPALKGKWIFTRLIIPWELPSSLNSTYEVHLQRNVGSRLTQSSIAVNGEAYGSIMFSLLSGTV